jgi:hypothetical protein
MHSMTNILYDLYFSGKIIGQNDPEQVRLKVGRIFGVDSQTLDRLFSGKPVRIKAAVDQETAIRYRVALRDAGALLDIKPRESDTVAITPSVDMEDGASLTLLPPNTGDLTDCTAPAEPFLLPDITDITLAPTGAVIDESDSPTARPIDTGELTMAEPNTGSLEDCYPVAEPKPIPDIAHIELVHDEPANHNTEK